MKRTGFSLSPAVPLCWFCAAIIMPPAQLVCFALAIAVHEAAHLAAMRLLGISVLQIRVLPAGLEISRGGELTSYGADAAVSLAGPAASVVTGAACLAFGGWFRLYGILSLILGTFNALPILGLDGGAALLAFLSARLPPEKAKRFSNAVSMSLTVALWTASVWIMLVTDGNASLFVISCLLFFSQAFGK